MKYSKFLTFLFRYAIILLQIKIIILSARNAWRALQQELNKPKSIHLSCVGADDTSGIGFADCYGVATDLG